jgi:hypothetical protein
MELSKENRELFLKLAKEKRIYLEGNIPKVLTVSDGDTEFNDYLKFCISRDNELRRKRLDVTKQVQSQNKELEAANLQNMKLMEDLKHSLEESNQLRDSAEKARVEAEKAKDNALNDLDVLQKKTQTELIGTIVKVALWVIIGVGIVTSLLYLLVLLKGGDAKIIESTWSNLFGILLTNSFSIIGTIMGVKYASETKK